nr:LPP20 family lipoprotein [Sulfurimonas sp. SAG-AH-194-C21]
MKFFILLVCIVSSTLMANPMWYLNVQKTKANSYIGYGIGENDVKAKQEALNDISSQISVSVETSMKQSEKLSNGKFESSDEFSSLQRSKSMLNDYELLKMEYYNGNYYVAVEYENIPSLDKFYKKLRLLNITQNTNLNPYLKHTMIAKKLKKSLGKNIDFSLLRKDKKWFIKYKSVIQVLDKKDFASFFTSTYSKELSLKTSKKRDILYDGDKFYFNVVSKKDGYVSILSVYEDGTVSTLIRNVKISKVAPQKIPDEEFETIPEAGLITQGVETYDLYVLVFSKNKLHFDSFAYADSELIDEEKYKNFDELIEFLDKKSFTTLKVVTKPKR